MDPPRTEPGSSESMFGLMEGPILEGDQKFFLAHKPIIRGSN